MDYEHKPVLLNETIELLQIQQGKWYIDATFGRGGHTKKILEAGGKVLAIDCDEEAVALAARGFVREIEAGALQIVRENFEYIDQVVGSSPLKEQEIAGILADFGVSSPQLDDGERGFSFERDAMLDMRMDKRLGVTAKDLVNALGKKELYEIFTRYAQDKHARVIVHAIIDARSRKAIETTAELAKIVEKVVPRTGRLHPATKTFMALRMVVNDELGSIERFLPKAFELLSKNGRLATISFHEGEDRLVKEWSTRIEQQQKGLWITKKPLSPSEEETQENPRSRSAKLRVIEKIV